MPIPAATRSKAWVCGLPGVWIYVSCECCVLSGKGLCVGLITRLKESVRLWSWSFDNEEVLAH